MAEIWDAYLVDGSLAGCDLVRDEPIPEGLFHLVSEILVRHVDGDYLLMHRDPRKPNFGGWYEASAGGSALKGEDSLACAKRELHEETGITRGNFTFLGKDTSHNTHYVHYLCTTDWPKDGIIMQEGETDAYKWVSEEAFHAFLHSAECMPQQSRQLIRCLAQGGG